jgi:hypothetical protein
VIKDTETLENLRKECNGVDVLRGKIQRGFAASVTMGGGGGAFAMVDAAHNLPMIHAFGVLDNALEAMCDQGEFECKKRSSLGSLMHASRERMSWWDFDGIDAGVKQRNTVAHEGKLFRGLIAGS